MLQQRSGWYAVSAFSFALIWLLFICFSGGPAGAQAGTWPSHSHDAQHSGISSAAVGAQTYNKIHWQTPVDLKPPVGEITIHYGSPLVTAANTVIVPVKTGTNSFRLDAHNGATGAKLWQLNTGYTAPISNTTPGLGPAIFGKRLFVPDTAGLVTVRLNPDQTTGAVSKLYFYGQKTYQADPKLYQQYIEINTPLTTDSKGNIYFGFLALGTTPAGLQSGVARIAANGTGTWASVASISGDSSINEVSMSAAPAVSHDGSTIYVATSSGDWGYGYLVALNSTTLAVINKVRLLDPSSGMDATMSDSSSGAPTVGPDGDVYYGVLENPFPNHNDRGWLLHFNSDLSQTKTPGSFGWDDTASIVPANLVSSYLGTSKYLVMTKYNNYAGIGSGDGHNRIAILDPNATENDPVISSVKVMKEVISKLGVTPDPNYPSYPGAVREWCVNTTAVDPITKALIVNNEDGKLYRWDLTNNTLSQRVKLSGGLGEAYTPTVIGADGTVYAINYAKLSAVGR